MRLFIAIEPPRQVRKSLTEAAEQLTKARASGVDSDKMHITLVFLGDLDADGVKKATQIVEGTSFQPVKCKVSGIGAFGWDRPSVVFADITEGRESLIELNGILSSQLKGLGTRVEHREYSPHITLARTTLRSDFGKINEFFKENEHREFGEFVCKGIVLKESIPNNGGHRYNTIAFKRFS